MKRLILFLICLPLLTKAQTNCNNLVLYCDSIDFSNTDFSTTIPLHTIVISKKDIDLNSDNHRHDSPAFKEKNRSPAIIPNTI